MYITIENISNVEVDELTNMWVSNILSSVCLRFSPFSVIFYAIYGAVRDYFDGLGQDCSISIANTLEILQSCTKPSICTSFIIIIKSEIQQR